MIMKGCVFNWEHFTSSGAWTRDRYLSRPAINPLGYQVSFFMEKLHGLSMFAIGENLKHAL